MAFIQPVILYVSAVDCTLFDVVVSSLELISSPPLKGIYEGLLRGLGAPARYDWPVITLSLILKYRYLVCVCVCVCRMSTCFQACFRTDWCFITNQCFSF